MMDLLHYEDKPQTRGGFFWWSVIILLMTGGVFASWILSFYVVAHPENPKCYGILKKLKRLEPPKQFEETQVPRGEFLPVGKLLERYGKLGPQELAKENAEMLRAYIMNYRETKTPPVYVVGKYGVMETHLLGHGDLFPSGAVMIAQSLDSPQMLLEMVFTAPAKIGLSIHGAVSTGTNVVLGRSRDLVALIHVERLADGRMQFTAIPLAYGGWQVKPSQVTFDLSSPEELEVGDPKLGKKGDPTLAVDVAAGLPIIRGERLAKGTAAYAEYRRKTLATDQEERTPDPVLVRFDPSKDETENAVAPKVVRPPGPATPRPPAEPVPPVPLPVRPVMVTPPAPRPAPGSPLVPPVVAPPTPAPAAAPAAAPKGNTAPKGNVAPPETPAARPKGVPPSGATVPRRLE